MWSLSVEEFLVGFTEQCLLVLVYFNFFLFLMCVLCMFLSTMAVLEPFSQIKNKYTCLVFRRLFYIYVSYFYIFFYGYLLHIVVYITVV